MADNLDYQGLLTLIESTNLDLQISQDMLQSLFNVESTDSTDF